MHAGEYIYVTWIFLAQGIFWHNRTQYLCVTEEELLYDSCERGFDCRNIFQLFWSLPVVEIGNTHSMSLQLGLQLL